MNAFDPPATPPMFSRSELANAQKPKHHNTPKPSSFTVPITTQKQADRTRAIGGNR